MAVGSIGGTYGLSGSGMDIDAIVKSLMTAQQAKADALLQKKTVVEWQKAAYNTVYDDINNFRTAAFNFKLQSTLSPNKVTSSNTSVATVTANADAAEVNHSLVVAQLADGIKMTSSASLSVAGTTVDRTSIASQFYTALDPMTAMSITITNGSASTTIAVNPADTTQVSINDFVSKINNAGINVTANYDTTLDRFFLTTNNAGATADISFAGTNTAGMTFLTGKLKLPVPAIATGSNVSSSGSIQATIHAALTTSLESLQPGCTGSVVKLINSATNTNEDINIVAGDTIQDLMDKINAGSNATASFDSITGQFSITPTPLSGTLSIDSSNQIVKDLFSKLHLPATFNSGKVTTSTSSVNIPLNNGAYLKDQFAELASAVAFNMNVANGTDTATVVTIDPTIDTLQTMLDKINAVPGVDAAYDLVTGKITLKSEDSQNLTFSSDTVGTSFLANTLKLHQAGQDAVFKLDGVALTEASNSFSISGVTYNLTGVSDEATMLSPGVMSTIVGKSTSVSVTNDTDTAVASIQSLVDSYNKILASVNGKVGETRYKDFPPLTVAQKSVMKEADITAWETKAKSGMLHSDPTLSSLVNTMRNAFSNPVTGGTSIYNSASSIGITTGAYTEGGKLYLSTDKLRASLNANPNVLSQLFGASGTDSNSQGIAGRLYDGIKTKMDQLSQMAGTTGTTQYDSNSNYAKRIIAYNLQISSAADRFDAVQTAYYKKFNAMEVALKQLSSQSSWLDSFGTTSY